MQSKQKYSLFLFFLTIVVAAILSFVVDGHTIILRFINSLFYLALLYIIIGGFLYVTEQGFFNVTKYAFKKVFKKKEAKLLNETVSKEMIYEQKRFFVTIPLLVNGITFAVFSFLISLLFI